MNGGAADTIKLRKALDTMASTDVSERLGELVGDVFKLEAERNAAEEELADLRERLTVARNEITCLNLELAESVGDEVIEWIADVRRGILSLEELYERALGS